MANKLLDKASVLTDEQAGGHGSHWEVVHDDVETMIEQWLPKAVADAELVSFGMGSSGQAKAFLEAGEPDAVGLLYRAEPDCLNAGMMAIIEREHDGGAEPKNVFASAYPFMQLGLEVTAKVKHIWLHPNRLEGLLQLDADGGGDLIVFDSLFWQHRLIYSPDDTYRFILAALAYNLEPTGSGSVRFPAPRPEHGREAAFENVDLDRVFTMFPSAEASFDVTFFMGEVVAVNPRAARLLGVDLWRVDVEVSPGETGFALPVYIAESGFSGAWRPEPGEHVNGMAWLQAYALARADRVH